MLGCHVQESIRLRGFATASYGCHDGQLQSGSPNASTAPTFFRGGQIGIQVHGGA